MYVELVKSEDEMNEAARRVIASGYANHQATAQPRVYPDTYEGDFAQRTSEDGTLSIRTRNILKKYGMEFVGDLVRYYREHGVKEAERLLIANPSCGARSVAEITLAYRKIEMARAFTKDDPDAGYITWCLKHRDIIDPIRKLSGDD